MIRKRLRIKDIRLMFLLLAAALMGFMRVSAPDTRSMSASALGIAEASAPVELLASGSTVVASGKIAPASEAQLSFPVSGRVQTVNVAEGDEAQPDDVLAQLETDQLKANVAQAEAAVAAAEAQLAIAEADPLPEEIKVAEAQLEAAEATLSQAVAQRDQLASAPQAAIAAAEVEVTAAEGERLLALENRDKVYARESKDWEKENADYQLYAAREAQAAAQVRLEAEQKTADDQIRAAEAAVSMAAAQRDAAQAQLDDLKAGPSAEEIAVAEAAVAQAEAALQAARAMLDQATLRAPFDGAVAALGVSPGETVMPGQPVLTLAALSRLQAETTDLSERDVALVSVGQPATVHVEALGVEIKGQVVEIAPRANTAGGDVVYAVTIALDEQPPGLRWGMSVEVEIEVD